MALDPSDMELATRVDGENGRYEARLSDDWEIWGPNGGYLATFALRAAGLAAEIKRPASFYCHFLNSPAFDAVQLGVKTIKRGRRAESFSVEMTQDGKPILQALVKTVAEGPGHNHQHSQAPDVAPPETLETPEDPHPERRPRFNFWKNLERRPIDRSGDDNSEEPVLREWARFRPRACFEDPFVDAARSLILLDTYGFPASYQLHRSMDFLAPNLDTSAWFHRSSPDSEWLLIDHECPLADRGLMAVNGRVWDADGNLLATGSAQLCCVPNPR